MMSTRFVLVFAALAAYAAPVWGSGHGHGHGHKHRSGSLLRHMRQSTERDLRAKERQRDAVVNDVLAGLKCKMASGDAARAQGAQLKIANKDASARQSDMM